MFVLIQEFIQRQGITVQMPQPGVFYLSFQIGEEEDGVIKWTIDPGQTLQEHHLAEIQCIIDQLKRAQHIAAIAKQNERGREEEECLRNWCPIFESRDLQ